MSDVDCTHYLRYAIGTLRERSNITRQLIDTRYFSAFMYSLHRIRPAAAFGLLSLSATLWLAGCAAKPVTENVPPPRIDQHSNTPLLGDAPENMLDWAGTYQAVLPSHGNPGTAISVQLRDNRTAIVRQRLLGSDIDPASAPTYSGPFRFAPPGGSIITLQLQQHPPAYSFFVAEGWIEMREASSGAPLPQGTLLRLRKTSEPAQ